MNHVQTRPIVDIIGELDVRDLAVDFVTICKRHGVTLWEVMGPRRPAHVCAARRACWCLLRCRGWSFPSIARLWGMDHTTIMHGVRKAASDAVMAELKRSA